MAASLSKGAWRSIGNSPSCCSCCLIR
jgi:hypothetical protein